MCCFYRKVRSIQNKSTNSAAICVKITHPIHFMAETWDYGQCKNARALGRVSYIVHADSWINHFLSICATHVWCDRWTIALVDVQVFKRKWTPFSWITTSAFQINRSLYTQRTGDFIEHGLSVSILKGFYRLNLSLLQTCQITVRVNFVNKNYCGQKFALTLLLLKVWTEFRGKARMDIKEWECLSE